MSLQRNVPFQQALSSPEVPYPCHAVLPTRVHPAAILVEADGGDILAHAVVVDDGVGVVGVEVVHADVLVPCGSKWGSAVRGVPVTPSTPGLTCSRNHAAVGRDLQGVHLLPAVLRAAVGPHSRNPLSHKHSLSHHTEIPLQHHDHPNRAPLSSRDPPRVTP